jgi:hypothetical protein
VSVTLLVLACAAVAVADTGGSVPDGTTTQADLGGATIPFSSIRRLPDSSTIEQAVVDALAATSLTPQPALLAVPGDDHAGCTTDYLVTTAPGCVLGDPSGTRTVVLWGDSHAWMWLPAFDAIGKSSQTQIVEFTKSSCAPQDMRIWLDRLRRPYAECDEFRRFVEERIATLRPDMVVLTGAIKGVRLVENGHGSDQGVEEAWATGLAGTIQAVAPYAGQTIILGDIAYPVQDPADCLSLRANDFHACDTPRSGTVDEYGMQSGPFDDHNKREQQVAEQNGAHYVGVTRWLCTDMACPAVIGGLAVYRDYFHLSPNYVAWLSNAVGQAVGLLR